MRSSFQIQLSVIRALFFRELKTRFGKYSLGYAWALLEPLAHVLILVFIFSFIRIRGGYQGIEFALFFAAGIIPYLLFSKIAISGATTVEANKGLFNYRQVKPFDAFITRALLESIIYFLASIILLILFAWWGFDIHLANPLFMLMLLAIVILFGLGLSLLLGVAAVYFNDVAKFASMLLRPMYLLSGVLFPFDRIPQPYQDWLLLNPIAHAVELMRVAWFGLYFSPATDLKYLSLWTLSLCAVGMLAYRSHWRKMVAA